MLNLFYGAIQVPNGVSAYGMVLYLEHSRYFFINPILRPSTNTQAKLLALRGILKFENMINVNHLYIVGDSK